MSNPSPWIGIDVSQETLDIYIRPLEKAVKVKNTEVEIARLVESLQE
ncbi:Mobile element protein [Geitlerinema sp. FC II]|nr:hypothetical protein [Geitlerinema sp. CS-897]PPT08246.1 Mobile element protein [Geitlerinema sp. FC II]